MLCLKCKGQVVSIDVDERFADKYINANTVHWEFCERWNGMVITAQFTQKQGDEVKTYNVVVDDVTSTTTLPNEITAGDVFISAFGVHPVTNVRITTVPVKKTVDKSGFVGDGETPIPPTPDLYTQLLAKIDEVGEIPAEEIQSAVEKYLADNPVQAGATAEQAAQIEANKQAIENYVPPVTSVNGKTGDVVIETGGGQADSVDWEDVENKPETYPPAEHTHPITFPVTSVNGMTGDVVISAGGGQADSVAWGAVTGKPEAYPPEEHTHSYADLEDKPTIPVVPQFLPNPYPLKINEKEYNGSESVEVTVATAWGDIADKPEAFPPEGHTHSYEDLDNKPAIPVVPNSLPNPYPLTINGKAYNGSEAVDMNIEAAGEVDWDNVTGKPETYPPAEHTHPITFPVTSVNGKTGDVVIEAGGGGVSYARNLLDNSDFTNPVDQRNKTSYNAKGYSIDRWKLASNGLTAEVIEGIGVKLTNTAASGRVAFAQVFEENYVGRTLTAAVCDADTGNVYCASGTVPPKSTSTQMFSVVDFNNHTLRLEMTTSGALTFTVMVASGGTLKLRWAAVYEGEYTTANLPPYRSKGRAAELKECLRYYQSFDNYTPFVGSTRNTAGYWFPYVHTKVTMRGKPSLSGTPTGEAFYGGGLIREAPTITEAAVLSYESGMLLLSLKVAGMNVRVVYDGELKGFAVTADL